MAKSFKDYLADFYSAELFGFDSSTGQIIPQTSSVKSAVKEMLNNIFNLKLNIEDETPAGRLCEAITMAISRFCSITAMYSNQINPYYSTGQMLDAIGSLFSITRTGASPTSILVSISGAPTTLIPSGSLIEDGSGNSFRISSDVTIGDAGTANAVAICTKNGNIEVAYNTVTKIISTVPGWSAVSNIGTVSVGSDIESDESFRSRVINSRWTGVSFVESITGSILRTGFVDSVLVIDNGEPDTRYLTSDKTLLPSAPPSGKYVALNPHSICVIVHGKALSDNELNNIAEAIYKSKSAGCGYTSLSATDQGEAKGIEVQKIIKDEFSGVEYSVIFNTPSIVNFSCNVVVGKGSFRGTDSDLIESTKKALQSWTLGEAPFVDALQVGQSIYSFEAGAAISSVIPAIQVKSV
jgi:hypothetical protein